MDSSSDDYAGLIMNVLCRYGCHTSVQQLFNHLTDEGIRISDYRHLLGFLENYPKVFYIKPGREAFDAVVYIHAPVALCSDHCSENAQCQDYTCNELHICKYFLLSKCGRQSCAYGHTLQTKHNLEVLQPYLMDRLSDDNIKIILSDIRNRTYLTKPEICRFYNVAKGCSNPNCQFLHVCSHFISSTCKFGPQCKRSHNIADLGVPNLLERYGICMSRSEPEILSDLRFLFEISEGPVAALDGLSLTSPIKGRRSRSAAPRQSNRRMRSPSLGSRQPIGTGAGVLHQRDPVHYPGARPKILAQGSMNPRGHDKVMKKTFGKQMSEPSDKEKLEICMYKLKGKCWYDQQCVRHHKDTLYQWQFMLDQDQEWQDFEEEENLDLETNFCQPEKTEFFVRKFGDLIKISFVAPMTGKGKKIMFDVQRLSTMSSEDPSAHPAMVQWTTEWKWYWEGYGGEWVLYGEKDSTGMKSTLSSETIETEYLANTKGIIDFETIPSSYMYKLNFDTMMQVNAQLSTQRKVRRRPQFFEMEDLKKRTSGPQSALDTVPKDWRIHNFKTVKTLMDHYAEIEVASDSEEFCKVKDLFAKTVSSDKIRSVTRIENGELWSSFSVKMTQMTTKAAKPVKELGLFHGTNEQTIPPICHQGFDFRFSGSRVGAKLGKGSYFARDSQYSKCYTQPDEKGLAKMFMARVLVGDYTVGSRDYVRPPQKSVNDPYELYDSCVDNTADPSIYVVFSLEQCYPEYLITYVYSVTRMN